MGKYKKLESLQKLKENGSLPDEEFKIEKEKLLNNTKSNTSKKRILIIILIIVILIICGFGVYYFIDKNKKAIKTSATENFQEGLNNDFEQTSNNINVSGTENISFENISSDDERLTDIQKDIISYFDNDYLPFSFSDAQQYPQIFQNSKITTSAAVVKVLKSTDDEFEVLAVDCGESAWNYYKDYDIEDIPEKQLLIVSGKQLNERLLKEDIFFLYGRYKDVENREIDGKTYMVSKIEANNIVKYDLSDGGCLKRYSYDTVKNVAEYIFGKDIKISEDNDNLDYYKITLDNQSNANFKVFDIYKNYGNIEYDIAGNDLGNNIQKRLFISADFQHYIVSTYDENTKHVYIDYFNRNLEKVWSREFNYVSTKSFISPMDYTSNQMAVVVDNDLYLINLETGENIIEPVIVGEKVRVVMMSDGIVLIGDNNKDAIMKVDYEGKIIFKTNIKTNMESIISAYVQIVNGKMVVMLEGPDEMGCYLIINSDGVVESIT